MIIYQCLAEATFEIVANIIIAKQVWKVLQQSNHIADNVKKVGL